MARAFSNPTVDTIQNTSIAALSTSAGTVGFWFNPTWSSGDSVWHELFGIYATAVISSRLEMLKYLDNKVYVGFFNGSGRISIADTGLFVANTWTYITFTYSNAPAETIYFNAVSKGTGGDSPIPSLTRLEVGNAAIQVAAQPANGSIADFSIWNVVLSAGEITALAKGVRPFNIRPLNLVIYWPLDGLQSPEPDLSGNAKNGTVTGTTAAVGPPFMPFTPRWPQFNQAPSAAPVARIMPKFFFHSGALMTGAAAALAANPKLNRRMLLGKRK